MATLSIQTLWNANVYVEGVSYLGAAAEVEVPQPIRLMQDYKALGMMASIKTPVGWDVMEARIRWSSFLPSLLSLEAQAFNMTSLSVLGDIQVLASSGQISEMPAIFNMTGLFTDVGRVGIQGQENAETDSVFNAYHVELFVNGLPIYVFDALSNTFTVNGADQLAQFKANLGIM